MTAREVARRVLERVDQGGAWATLALDAELGRSGLDERDRRLASELVYGVLRHRTRIDRAIARHADLKKTPPKVVTALRVAAYQLLYLDRVPAYAVVDDAVGAARAVAGGKLAGFTNAVLRKVGAAGHAPLPLGDESTLARIEVEHSLPRWMLDELAAAAPPERLAAIAGALAESAPIVARTNLLRIERDVLADELRAAGTSAEPIAGAPAALRLGDAGDPATSPTFLAGKWTVQDAGAQRVAQLAAPRAGMRVLDACAGVGGKSTHLAELSSDAAVIIAADQSSKKLGHLVDSAARLGHRSITTVLADLLDPAWVKRAGEPALFDLIVLDAPCSGLGVLRRHPDAKWRMLPDSVPRLAGLQRLLLDALVPLLAPGGAFVYSVCTFTRAEGPEQMAAFAQRHGLRVVVEERTWPPEADAFYLARLER